MRSRTRESRPTIKVRNYREGDEIEMNALYNRVFGKERTLQSWRLKFTGNPANSPVYASIAESDGEIVGMLPALVATFKMGEQEVLFGLPVEISVHPDYRDASLIYRLKRSELALGLKTNVRLALGFPTKDHAKVGFGYLGYRRLGDFPILYKDYRRFLDGINPVPWEASRKILAMFLKVYRRSKYSIKGWRIFSPVQVEKVIRFDDAIDRLWKRVEGNYKIIRVRRKEYLNWKYFGNPEEKFEVFSARKGGETLDISFSP